MEFKKRLQLELNDLTTSAYSIIAPKLLIMALLIAVLSICIILLLFGTSFFKGYDWIAAVIAIIVTIGFFILLFLLNFKKQHKKQFNSNALLREEFQVIIDNDSFSQISNSTNSKVSWNMIYRVKELKDSYNFYISNIMYVLIPKRFLTPEEESILRDLVNKNLDPKKNKLKSEKA